MRTYIYTWEEKCIILSDVAVILNFPAIAPFIN